MPVVTNDVRALRLLVGHLIGDSTDMQLAEVLNITGDFDLAATAIEMLSRPKWLADIVGPRLQVPDVPPKTD